MAIKKKDEVKQSLPSQLQGLLTKAFGEQFLKTKFEDMFKATKSEMEKYLNDNDDGFDIEAGKAVKSAEGSFYYTETERCSIDKDALIAMVEAKEITLAQVLMCVSTFKNEELEKAISTKKFEEIAKKSITKSLTLKANAEYKAKLEEDFNDGDSFGKAMKEIEKEEPKLLDTSKLKKKKAEKKVSKKVESVDDDLDSILKE